MAELSNAGPFLRPAKTVWRTFAILRTKSYQTPVCKVGSGASQRTGGRFCARPIWRRRFQHRSEATEGVRGSSPGLPLGAAATAAGENGSSPPTEGRESSRHEKSPGRNGSDFRVWMTGLEPATSWSLTRCATNCATSRGPFFKGTANIGILFRKNKRKATYFSAGGVDRASCRAFRADLRAEEAFIRRIGPLTQAKVFRSSFSSSGLKLG